MKREGHKIVEVKWYDAHGCHTDWTDLREFEKDFNVIIYTYGILVHKGKTTITVVPHITDKSNDTSQQGCGEMTINLPSIIHIREMRYGR